MKNAVAASLLSLASIGASAGTYEISLSDISWSVIDLTPGDAFFPNYTVTSGSLVSLLSPVDIHEAWGEFESGTVLPPNVGESASVQGLLYPGTQLVWKASGRLSISVIDVDGLWDYESIEVRTTFYSSDAGIGSSYLELRTGLLGSGGTYKRITESFDFGVHMTATNFESNVPIWYEIGWFNQIHTDSFDGTPPIPEPSTYAMMLGGLAAMALVARRRERSSAGRIAAAA